MNLSKKDKLWYAFIAIAVILPCIPGVIGGSFFGHVATMVLLYASMAQSWNIISGYGGQVSFGHSVFFGIGAYGAGLAVVTFGSLPWFGAPLGMLAAAAVSIIISYPCFRLKGHYFAIATFAIVEIFNRLFMIWDAVGGALGLDYPILPDGWVNFSWSTTKTGYYIGALAIFLLVFGIGGACVGVAGGLMTTYLAVHPEVGALFSLIAFVVVALGGFGSIPGALAAALLIGLVESFSGFYIAAVVKYVAGFAIYRIVILVRPKGLFGW